MSNNDLEYMCERCGVWFVLANDPDNYLGPVDREDTTCNPFIAFESICGACERGKNESDNTATP